MALYTILAYNSTLTVNMYYVQRIMLCLFGESSPNCLLRY